MQLKGMQQLQDAAESHEENKYDVTVPAGYLGFEVLTSEEEDVEPLTHMVVGNHVSLGQTAHTFDVRPIRQMMYRIQNRKNSGVDFAGGAAKHIVHDMHPNTQAQHLNEMIDSVPGNQYLIRSYAGEAISAYSEKYKVCDPIHLIEAVDDAMKVAKVDPEVSGYVTRYGMNMRLRFDNVGEHIAEQGGGSVPYTAGFIIKTGKSSSHVMAPYIQRGPCANSSIFYRAGEEGLGFSLQHRYSKRLVQDFIYENLEEVMEQAVSLFDSIESASLAQVANFGDTIAALAKKTGLSNELGYSFFNAASTQGGETLLGIGNGFSQVAQAEGLTLEKREELEALSGFFMMGGGNVNAYLTSIRSAWTED